jgi:hypothetical protein
MRGTMILMRPELQPELRTFDRAPTLEELQAVVGGDVQEVPSFRTIGFGDTVMDCVALCNEHGKADHLPINRNATIAWARALRRSGEGELYDDKSNTPKDWLVGTVAVLFGDREFMGEL